MRSSAHPPRIRPRGVDFEEAILSGRVNSIRLILVDREDNHAVERSCVHTS